MNLIRLLGTQKLRWKLLPLVKWGFLLVGKSWNDFYRWMLNLQERHTTLDMIFRHPGKPTEGERCRGLLAWGLGEYHLSFMQAHGLKSNQIVLDFGCGYGRTAVPLLKYLEPGNYVGTELSDKRVALAKEWVEREGLQGKKPCFVVSTDNTMPYLEDGSIDVVWTLSVFTHMPEKELHQVLAAFRRVVKPDGVVYFHYNSPLPGAPSVKPTVKDFYWENDAITQIICSHGFSVERIEDWEDNLDAKIQSTSNMLRLTWERS